MSLFRKKQKNLKAAKSQTSATEQQDDNYYPEHDSSDYILALDIGTEYVKALIAEKDRDEIRIVGVGKAHEAPGNMISGAIADIAGVAKVCEDALVQAEDMAQVRAREVVVGIAGELIKGNTASIRYHRSRADKAITDEEMERIIDRVQARAGERARKAVAMETNNPNVEVRLINSAIVSLKIDGQKVTNPIGFKGNEIVVQIYTAFAPLVHVSAIEHVCYELQLDLVNIAVEPFAVCRACLGQDVASDFTSIVMDIGGGTTDIAVVEDGGVEGTKMFSMGGRSFTHQVAERLGLDFESAEKLKLLSDNPNMKPELRSRFDKAINQNLEVWLSGVELALEDFSSDNLPGQILLCGGGAGLFAIPEALATGNWCSDLAFSRRPLVNLISAEDIPDVVNDTDYELDHTFITAMGLLRVGIDTLLGIKDSNSLRAKLARILKN